MIARKNLWSSFVCSLQKWFTLHYTDDRCRLTCEEAGTLKYLNWVNQFATFTSHGTTVQPFATYSTHEQDLVHEHTQTSVCGVAGYIQMMLFAVYLSIYITVHSIHFARLIET